jgi:hypothetical protein
MNRRVTLLVKGSSIVETSAVVFAPDARSIYWSIFSESIPIIAL